MGGGGVLFSALVFASISISAVSYDGVIGGFAEMVTRMRGVYGRVYIQNCPPCSTFFASLYRLVGFQLYAEVLFGMFILKATGLPKGSECLNNRAHPPSGRLWPIPQL